MQNEERLLTWKNGFGRHVAEFHQTGRPATSLSFSLSGPTHGWLFFTLDLGEGGRFTCRASSVPNNFLCELVNELRAFFLGAPQVCISMHGEPDTFVLQLAQSSEGNTRFELHYKPSFEATEQNIVWGVTTFGTSICNSLYKLVCGFGESCDMDAYASDMGWDFPSTQLASLQKILIGHRET
ncbi:MAG TPA: hypothetical protein VF450_05865 [Noviherbaspirillum sp.]